MECCLKVVSGLSSYTLASLSSKSNIVLLISSKCFLDTRISPCPTSAMSMFSNFILSRSSTSSFCSVQFFELFCPQLQVLILTCSVRSCPFKVSNSWNFLLSSRVRLSSSSSCFKTRTLSIWWDEFFSLESRNSKKSTKSLLHFLLF